MRSDVGSFAVVIMISIVAFAMISFCPESDAAVTVTELSVSEADSQYDAGLQDLIDSTGGQNFVKVTKVTYPVGYTFDHEYIGYSFSIDNDLTSAMYGYGFNSVSFTDGDYMFTGSKYATVSVTGTPTITETKIYSSSNVYSYGLVAFMIILEPQVVEVSSISISASESTIDVGGMSTLTATVSPSDATYGIVSWSIVSGSSYVDISTSDNVCYVYGIEGGTAKIRATANDGSGVYRDCSVTVNPLYYYSLDYSSNGGSGAPGTQYYSGTENTNHTFTISSTKPTWDGHLFLGWSTSSSASSATYQSGGTISVSPNGSKTLYAVWQQLYTYVFEFDANGGSGGPTSPQTYSGKTASSFSIDVPASVPTKSGSTFLGWSESSSATTPTYTVGGGQITITATGSSTTKTLYAVWSQESITVSGSPTTLSTKSGSSWSYTPDLSVSEATISVSGASWLTVVDGKVIGTPTAAGTYDITLTFSKSGYTSGTQTFSVTVVPALTFDSAPTGGVIAYAV